MALNSFVHLPKWFVISLACMIACLFIGGIQGRPLSEITENRPSQQVMADGHIVIDTGSIPLTGGTAWMMMGPFGWKYERKDFTTHFQTTTSKPKSSKPPPKQIITVPEVPKECPPGYKPDDTNTCREEWVDFRRIAGKGMTTARI